MATKLFSLATVKTYYSTASKLKAPEKSLMNTADVFHDFQSK